MSARRGRETEIAVIRPAQPRNPIQSVAGATERRLPGALEVPIEQVEPDSGQPRRDWTHTDGARRIEELAASIAEFGVLQPLVVREEGALPDGRQRYVVIAGARRRVAAERAGIATVPVIVRGESATNVRLLQLIENIQRHDLSPLDEARAYQELMDAGELSPPALADRLHVSAQHVRDRLRILGDQVLADAIERRQITATTARDIAQLPDDERGALRTRVESGEAVQAADIAALRARMATAGLRNPRRKGNGKQKQTAFVPAAPEKRIPGSATQSPNRSDRTGSDEPINGASETLPASDLRAAQVAMAIAESLDGASRTLVSDAMREIGDGSSPDAWWMSVYRHLRERLIHE
jgi:ParB/RepB/Spo0J family partition protein